MSWFFHRPPKPRRAIKPRLSQRPGIRVAAAIAGAGLLTAAIAGSMLQFSFAGGEESGDPLAVTTTSPALADPTTGPPNPTPRTFVFRTCKDVRDAGAYPLRRGEPGYGPHLDRNGNGLACEPE